MPPRTKLRSPESEWQRRTRRDRERAAYVEAHGDTCQLCGAARGERGLCGAARQRPLDVDHEHAAGHGAKQGRTLGFICGRANGALLGWMTPEWLRAAADYREGKR